LGERGPGEYLSRNQAAYWDGSNEAGEPVASGLYFYNIQTRGYSAIKKMIVVR
jgi:hypothetical protein